MSGEGEAMEDEGRISAEAAALSQEEQKYENALRPQTLDEFTDRTSSAKILKYLSNRLSSAANRLTTAFSIPRPTWKNYLGAHNRERDGRQPSFDIGPGTGKSRRPGRNINEPGARGCFLH